MSASHSPIHGWQKLIQSFVSHPRITRIFSRFVTKIDRPILKLTHGRFSPTGFIAGWPVITLNTTGAQSGQVRTTPLIGIPDGDKSILVASNFGQANNPGWYYNLRTNPTDWVTYGGKSRFYQAYEASGEELDRYWDLAISTFSGYLLYQKRANRTFPIIVLAPTSPALLDSK